MAPIIPFIPLIAAGIGAAATGIAIAEQPSAPQAPSATTNATQQAQSASAAAGAQAGCGSREAPWHGVDGSDVAHWEPRALRQRPESDSGSMSYPFGSSRAVRQPTGIRSLQNSAIATATRRPKTASSTFWSSQNNACSGSR